MNFCCFGIFFQTVFPVFISFKMYKSRGRIDCCLKKVKKCTKRIENGKQRFRLWHRDFWDLFAGYLSNEGLEDFHEHDVVCKGFLNLKFKIFKVSLFHIFG